MKKSHLTYIRNIILPCLVYPAVTGLFTGGLIFLFKLAVSKAVPLSEHLYSAARDNIAYLPLLVLGAALLGAVASAILHLAPNCKGGGIPTSIIILRGLADFSWVKSIFLLFPSAIITYLCGVPLGTEGPAVQMGTAAGRGTVKIFAKKRLAWDRYIMTSGASAGFAAATGAPLTGIVFAFEEAHGRFNPMIFMSSAVSALTSTAVMRFLCPFAGISPVLFHLDIKVSLPLRYVFATVIIGAFCAAVAGVFAEIYSKVHSISSHFVSSMPLAVKIGAVFALTAVIGYFFSGVTGSGDHIIEELFEGHARWKLLIFLLCIRGIILIVSNNIGITGGLFVPNLCFGAIIGGLCAKAMISLGILPEEYYIICVITGIAAYLAAASKTPLMALVFCAEALGGTLNLLPVAAGVTVAYMAVETLHVHDFSEIVIDSKLRKVNVGKASETVHMSMTVAEGSFAEGKQVRDILWPPRCTVLSVRKKPSTHHHSHTGISSGDELELHFETYNKEETVKILNSIVSK